MVLLLDASVHVLPKNTMPPATVHVLDSIPEHVASETDAKRMVAKTILDLGLDTPFDIHDDLNIDLEDPLPLPRLASNANSPWTISASGMR
eukprot:3466202-Rhodomonas_salina.1